MINFIAETESTAFRIIITIVVVTRFYWETFQDLEKSLSLLKFMVNLDTASFI